MKPEQPVVVVTPDVRLTFSSSVSCETNSLALVIASAQAPVASCWAEFVC